MLTLTRRIGETIYIGGDTCVTVYDRLRYHVILGVLTPASTCVRFGETCLRPAILPGGERFYLSTMLNQDVLWLDDIRVQVRFNPTYLSTASLRTRQLKISVHAPQTVHVDREEIHLRKLRAAGKRLPTMPFSAWLRQANLMVSRRAAA
ncbi:MAG: carbon storage regulator [Xanthomonadales bacterium]|nr:carbon storage regulator [Xanthomonadales bacterium]